MDGEEQEEKVISPISPLEVSCCIKMAKKARGSPCLITLTIIRADNAYLQLQMNTWASPFSMRKFPFQVFNASVAGFGCLQAPPYSSALS